MVSKTQKLLIAAAFVVASVGVNSSSMPLQAKEHQSDIVIAEERINNKPYQVTRLLIKSPPQQVWQVLTDYNSAPKVFPTLKKCRVLSDCGTSKRIHYQIHPSGIMTCFEYDLDVREMPHRLIEWRRVSGDFKAVEGFWKLEPADSGRSTIVTYASHVNGGFLLPQALIKRQTRLDFPQVMAALKTTAENTTQVAVRAQHSHSAN